MSFLNDCFNTMLEYGEAIKSSFVKGHVSDWPEEPGGENETPASVDVEDEVEPVTEPEVMPEETPGETPESEE
jgi:hypothetical protein